MTEQDVLACPTMALPPPPITDKEANYTNVDADGKLHGLDMTCLFNSIGQCPALSVPNGMTATGLPTAIQLVGRRFDDATPLRIARALEQLCPWLPSLEKLNTTLFDA
jgi:Asp-tRNA(Asn)/Glu-tRNA(Gln) amidotransferase A subunit family amidase